MNPLSIPGWMEPLALVWLEEQARHSKSWLEIGCLCGRSTVAVARGLPHGARLTVVDPFLPVGDLWKHDPQDQRTQWDHWTEAVKWINKDRPDLDFQFVKKTSHEFFPISGPLYDTVFLDGNHMYPFVSAEIYMFWPKIPVGGILAGHDYGHNEWPGVKAAVDGFCGKPNLLAETSIWWVKK